jgi:SAM-dependent methyltransferase
MKKILDVGCGTNKVVGSIGLDVVNLDGVDVVHDLDLFPCDPVKGMEEIHRILKPGGKLNIRVVYWNHKYSFSDPTHKHYFSEISWEFFTGKRRAYYTKAKFTMAEFKYTYDENARRIFRFEWLMRKLSYFLCNIIDGMQLILVKD